MIPAKLAGAVILGVPLIFVAYAALWRRQRPVFWFALALILVGLGYLMATGATDDIARSIVPAPVLQPAGWRPTQEPTDMSTPKTLLEMAGADLNPPPLAQSTLVIIDAQNEYLDGKLALPGIAPAVDALARLLAKARAAGAPVVHVQHKGRAGGLFDLDARGGAIIDAVKPAGGESIVSKPLPNAFAQTDLDATLKSLGRTQLVIAGFMTHMCVSSTARAALDLGYKATVAADAAATRDLPDPMGGVIAADALHRAALAELADRFAIVATVDRIPEK